MSSQSQLQYKGRVDERIWKIMRTAIDYPKYYEFPWNTFLFTSFINNARVCCSQKLPEAFEQKSQNNFFSQWKSLKNDFSVRTFDSLVPLTNNFNYFSASIVSFVVTSFFAFTNAQLDISLGNSTDHQINCTINNVVYFDDDCTNFIKRFITWLGFGLLICLFLFCGCLWYCICFLCQAIFCKDRYNPRMFSRDFPNYSTIPWRYF